jgi:vesicle-associated membrane protein 7
MALANKRFPPETAMSMLEETKTLFTSKFTANDIENVVSYCFNDQFQETLRTTFDKYKDPKNTIKIKSTEETLKEQLIDYKNIIVNTTDVLSERGGKMNLIVNKAEELSKGSYTYKKAAHKVRMNQKQKKILLIALGTVVGLLVIYMILVIACGGFGLDECINTS